MTGEEIRKWFNHKIFEQLKPRCPYCRAKLSEYWYYFESPLGLKQVQTCPECNKQVVKK